MTEKLSEYTLYEIDGEIYSLEEIRGFIESQKTVERKTRFTKAIQLANQQLTKERNDLIDRNIALSKELQDIKQMSMFEFGNTYCSDESLANDGKIFARSLLGHRMTDEDIAIQAAENGYKPYTAEDF